MRNQEWGKPKKEKLNKCRWEYSFPHVETELQAFRALTSRLYKFIWEEGHTMLGYMMEPVVQQLLATPQFVRGPVIVDDDARTVRAFTYLEPEWKRTSRIAMTTRYWRDHGIFDTLKGWRDEDWPVYDHAGNILFSVERSAIGLFGVMRYGVHLTAYVRDRQVPYGMKIVVAQRSPTKETYPNMLDNSVAGGLRTGENPFECIIREAHEEAGIPPRFMRCHGVFAGNVTYMHIADERSGGEVGQIYPEMQWIFDVEVPADFKPKSYDGEVARFYLWTVDEVREKLAQGLFKPNCALVLLNFLMRHGIITRDNEPDYSEILCRMHRKLPFPMKC